MRSRDIASNIGADETMLAHAALLKAIEQGQSEQARRIMADHLSSQLATLLS
jgi:DNA-binding FadR family transcriptional regulator